MKHAIAFTLLGMALAGCDGGGPDNPSPEHVPLTQAEWQTMPADQKYEVVTFERLKLGNPELQDDREWNRFYKSVVLPAKKADSTPPAK